jgi:hypothetical protein
MNKKLYLVMKLPVLGTVVVSSEGGIN